MRIALLFLSLYLAEPLETSATLQLTELGLQPCAVSENQSVIEGLAFDPAAARHSVGPRPQAQVFCDPDMPEDRYGRPIAQVLTDDRWLQFDHVLAGEWVVMSARGETRGMDHLLLAESEARAAKRGVWANGSLLRTPETALQSKGRFALVIGKVISTGRGRDYDYLNFGTDWRTDFTVRIGRLSRSHVGIKPQALKGACVEVRGTVLEDDGPVIDLAVPGQIRPSTACSQ